MDAFIQSFAALSNQIMPILGAICLVCGIILLIKLIKVLGSLDATLIKSHKTIDLVDESIQKAQAPLDTVVKVSKTVDKAHDATVEAVGNAKDYIVKSAENIKDKVVTYVNGENNNKDELMEPKPEDILGE